MISGKQSLIAEIISRKAREREKESEGEAEGGEHFDSNNRGGGVVFRRMAG